MGLVSKVATRHQQQNFPMMAFIGCQYHFQYLETEDQKTDFKEFNLQGIAQRVADQQLRPICDAVLAALPPPMVENKAALLHGMNALQVEKILKLSTDAEAEMIREKLRSVFAPCAWAVQEAAAKAAEAKEKFYESAAVELRKRWDIANASAVDRILAAGDAETRRELTQRARDLRAELDRVLSTDEMTGAQLMEQLRIPHREDLDAHWTAGMDMIRQLRAL